MLQVIVGKPGTGKTYHCVTMLVDHVTDWCRYELKEGEDFSRRLFTNVRIHGDALDALISKRLGVEVDAAKYVEHCGDDFFQTPHWWDKFPNGSLIVIDEVHHHLGSDLEGKSSEKDRLANFRNWVSTHRHQQQDIIFITQHIENIAKETLRIADAISEVTNLKQFRIPFPISISMADLDTIREAWGINTQVYVVHAGRFRGRAVLWDNKDHTSFTMVPEIFSVYQSHTLSDKAEDRPSLRLGRVGSLIWFARRHGFHLGIKFVIACVVIRVCFWMVLTIMFPSKEFMHSMVSASAGKNGSSWVAPTVSASPTGSVEVVPKVSKVAEASEKLVPLPPPPLDDGSEKINGVFRGGVVTNKGVRYVGDEFRVDGEKRKLVEVDVRLGVILFDGGYILRF